jgi:hypothetical protein
MVVLLVAITDVGVDSFTITGLGVRHGAAAAAVAEVVPVTRAVVAAPDQQRAKGHGAARLLRTSWRQKVSTPRPQ